MNNERILQFPLKDKGYFNLGFDKLEEAIYAHLATGIQSVLSNEVDSYTLPFLSMGDVEDFLTEQYDLEASWDDNGRDMTSFFEYEGTAYILSQNFGGDVTFEISK